MFIVQRLSQYANSVNGLFIIGAVGEMRILILNRIKLAPVHSGLPKVPYGLIWDRIWVGNITSRKTDVRKYYSDSDDSV